MAYSGLQPVRSSLRGEDGARWESLVAEPLFLAASLEHRSVRIILFWELGSDWLWGWDDRHQRKAVFSWGSWGLGAIRCLAMRRGFSPVMCGVGLCFLLTPRAWDGGGKGCLALWMLRWDDYGDESWRGAGKVSRFRDRTRNCAV